MKHNIISRMLYILTAIILLANTVLSVVSSLSPDISELPKGQFLQSTTSPKGDYQINFYLVKNNLGVAIRGERTGGGKKTNIYWQTGIEDVKTYWVDEYGIIINDIPLNIRTDRFDSRRGTAIFSDGVLAESITENE